MFSYNSSIFEHNWWSLIGITYKYSRVFTNVYSFVSLHFLIDLQYLLLLWSFCWFFIALDVCPSTISKRWNISIRVKDLQTTIFHSFCYLSMRPKCPALLQLVAVPTNCRIGIEQNCKLFPLDADLDWCALASLFSFLVTTSVHHCFQVKVMLPQQVVPIFDLMKTVVSLSFAQADHPLLTIPTRVHTFGKYCVVGRHHFFTQYF